MSHYTRQVENAKDTLDDLLNEIEQLQEELAEAKKRIEELEIAVKDLGDKP